MNGMPMATSTKGSTLRVNPTEGASIDGMGLRCMKEIGTGDLSTAKVYGLGLRGRSTEGSGTILSPRGMASRSLPTGITIKASGGLSRSTGPESSATGTAMSTPGCSSRERGMARAYISGGTVLYSRGSSFMG
jgi:hypothetical protein